MGRYGWSNGENVKEGGNPFFHYKDIYDYEFKKRNITYNRNDGY